MQVGFLQWNRGRESVLNEFRMTHFDSPDALKHDEVIGKSVDVHAS